jgi:hypothetical protein
MVLVVNLEHLRRLAAAEELYLAREAPASWPSAAKQTFRARGGARFVRTGLADHRAVPTAAEEIVDLRCADDGALR